MIIDKGYFNINNIYRQFFDESVAGGFLNYKFLLSYLTIVVIFYLANKKYYTNIKNIFIPFEYSKYKSFKIDISFYLLGLFRVNVLLLNFLLFVTLLKYVPIYLTKINFYDFNIFKSIEIYAKSYSLNYKIIVFIFAFIIWDLMSYLMHYLSHKNKILWQFHKIHHYPKQLSILSSYRSHPIDDLFAFFIPNFFASIIIAAALGIEVSLEDPMRLLDKNSMVYAIFFLIPTFLSKFNHIPLPISYGKYLNMLYVCPRTHHLHHSALVINKNFGRTLSIWDKIFNTYIDVSDPNQYKIHINNLGVSQNIDSDAEYKNIFQVMIFPFIDAYNLIKK